MIQQIICKKKRFFSRGLVWPQVTPSPRCTGQWCVTGQRSPTSYTLLTPCLSTAWPVGGGHWWYWSFCRGVLYEKHFRLTCMWVYFIRWLLLIGAFLALLCTFTVACGPTDMFHDSHMELLSPTTIHHSVRLQKLHPGTRFSSLFFFFLIFFCLCWEQWLLALGNCRIKHCTDNIVFIVYYILTHLFD